MKQKRNFTIFLTLIIILLIVAIILIFQSKNVKTDRVKKLYGNIYNSENVTLSMEEENLEFSYKIQIAQRGADTSINMYTEDEHTTTLILDKKAYYIVHSEEEYCAIDSGDVDGDLIISDLKEIVNEPYETGEEEIKGKKYYYEEYSNASAFYFFINANDEESIKTRFYFDGDELVYIKNISSEEDVEEELLKTNIEYDVDENLFIIPDSYAEDSNIY